MPTPNPLPDLTEMVEQVRPGVVRIQTNSGSGSGVIFETTPQGGALVLTNHHVIEGAGRIDVVVDDSMTYGGSLQGFDAYRDLAVVTICCGQFRTIPFGNAATLKPGSEVVAIGYPLGFAGAASVTRGIVSAVRYDSDYKSWVIQTDAAINPGNSGGPLFSPLGEVVGINTFKVEASQSGRPTEGLGFAVSEATVQAILPELTQGSKVGFPTPMPTPQPQWRTYTNRDYRYRVQVPDNWSVDDSDSDGVYFSSPDDSATVLIGVHSYDHYLSIADYADLWIEALKENSILFEVIENRSSGPNKAYLVFRYQLSAESCVEQITTMILIRGSQVFHILGTLCEHSLDEHRETVAAILGSFQSW